MGKINLRRVYHIGIPVNDLERAERFYVDVLGMRVNGPMAFKENGKRNYRVSDDNKPWRDQLGYFIWGPSAAKAVERSISSTPTAITSRWMIGQWRKKTVQNVRRLQKVQFV